MGRDSGNSVEEGTSNLSETTTPVSSGMHFFLQTVQVVVSRPAEGSTRGLHIQGVFDTGAQRSYITQKVVNVKTERLEIATFGDQKQGLEAVNLVELTFTKPAAGFETTLIAFLHIFVDLQGEAWVKATYPSLRDIEFSDACPDNSPMHVDLLIGSDYIWNFFDGQTIWGRSQVKVVHPTKGGWVLSGPVENIPREKLRSIQFLFNSCATSRFERY